MSARPARSRSVAHPQPVSRALAAGRSRTRRPVRPDTRLPADTWHRV